MPCKPKRSKHPIHVYEKSSDFVKGVAVNTEYDEDMLFFCNRHRLKYFPKFDPLLFHQNKSSNNESGQICTESGMCGPGSRSGQNRSLTG